MKGYLHAHRDWTIPKKQKRREPRIWECNVTRETEGFALGEAQYLAIII